MPPRRTATRFKHIAFVASDTSSAQKARRLLVRRYGDALPETADVVVALGGDGLMLSTLQRFMNSGKPIYGMHRGTVGFLMNEYSDKHLVERLAAAEVTVIHPLLMRARDAAGRVVMFSEIDRGGEFGEPDSAAKRTQPNVSILLKMTKPTLREELWRYPRLRLNAHGRRTGA